MATNHEKALREDIDMVSGGTVKFRMERHLEALLAERDDEIARLRAALKLFAAKVDPFFPQAPDTNTVTVLLSDCRAALKALEDV